MDKSGTSGISPAARRSTSSGRSGQAQSSEIRKEQNRVASRNYRHRRKQKLALLEQLLSPVDITGLESSLPNHSATIDSSVQVNGVGDGERLESFNTIELVSEFNPRDPDFLSSYSPRNDIPTLQTDERQGDILHLDMRTDLLNSPSALGVQHQLPTSPRYFDATNSAVGPMSDVSTSAMPLISSIHQSPRDQDRDFPIEQTCSVEPQKQDSMSRALQSLQSLSLFQKHQILGLLKLETDHKVINKANSDRGIPASTNTSTLTAGHATLVRIKTEATNYECWLRTALATSLSLPDPKVNSIRIVQSSFYAAILANSTAIGLFNFEVLKEDGLSPYSVDRKTGYSLGEIPAARARFATRIPPSLAPGDAQLSFAHHPYLDVIPFSDFRQRAISALTCQPPLFDEEELCHDFDAEGLICWGGHVDNSEKRGMEAEVPWDPRSWEPQSWFLEKYWFLVGGPDGEMHISARLWADRRA